MTSILVLLIHLEAQQCGPKFVGSRRQQALGLDAGLDGGIQPDEIQGDVADQCQVVGHVARAGTGVVVAELNIQATYNLAYNAAFLVEQGLGSMITFDGLVPCGTDFRPNLVFRPFIPALFSGNFIIWKKGRLLSKAAELLKQRMKSCFP